MAIAAGPRPSNSQVADPEAVRSGVTDHAPWPMATQRLLVAAGVVLFFATFVTVLLMPDLRFHPARDAELQATYTTYLRTGVPLIKVNGTGSGYGYVPGSGYTRAAGDDDPGTYLLAIAMSQVTHSSSPYPGIKEAMALLCALPLLALPTIVARIFGRARAGMAVVLAPGVMWLVNHGTVLIGTQYGLSDQVSPLRVYALYGFAASMAFLSLVVVAWLLTCRLGLWGLVCSTSLMIVLGAVGNLFRSTSGIGPAAAVAVLWWLFLRRRSGQRAWRRRPVRLLVAAVVGLFAIAGSLVVPGLVMARVDASRAAVIAPALSRLPDAHGTWHPLYLGLSYPQPITGGKSPFNVTWSDEFGWAQARKVDPDVVIASPQYDRIMRTLYLSAVERRPAEAVRLYLEKLLYTVKQFGAMIVFVALAGFLVLRRPGAHKRRLGRLGFAVAPTLVLGLAPAVLVMPMLYYYSELTAALGLLVVVALGGAVWAYTTLPSFIRVGERRFVGQRGGGIEYEAPSAPRRLSVVVPTRNGADVLAKTLESLGGELSGADEIIVVENGSTDSTWSVLQAIAGRWSAAPELRIDRSEPGLGNALRSGVLLSRGHRLLLTADDLPFGISDLDQFRSLPAGVEVAIGSKAHPDSQVPRSFLRRLQSLTFRWMRAALLHSAVGDSQGTFWVSGAWARTFARISRETGLMWTVELTLAAEQQGLRVVEVPVDLLADHDKAGSRFRLADAVTAAREIAHLAARRDDYRGDDWTTPGVVLARESSSL